MEQIYLLAITIWGALPETNIASATLGLENEFLFGQVWECILAKNSGRLQLLILSTSGVSLAQEHAWIIIQKEVSSPFSK